MAGFCKPLYSPEYAQVYIVQLYIPYSVNFLLNMRQKKSTHTGNISIETVTKSQKQTFTDFTQLLYYLSLNFSLTSVSVMFLNTGK